MACGRCRRRKNPAFGAAKYTKEQADALLQQGLIDPARHAELVASASGENKLGFGLWAGIAAAVVGGWAVGSTLGGKR